jgi:predicted aspartyl protease
MLLSALPGLALLTLAGQPVPNPYAIRGLIDTGATCTSIDTQILQQLGIPSTGTTRIHTPLNRRDSARGESVRYRLDDFVR